LVREDVHSAPAVENASEMMEQNKKYLEDIEHSKQNEIKLPPCKYSQLAASPFYG
jgi:hypothetical protein